MTDEQKDKISKALKGKMPKFIPCGWNKGMSMEGYKNFGHRKPHSEKTKLKIGLANKGHKHTEEVCLKIKQNKREMPEYNSKYLEDKYGR